MAGAFRGDEGRVDPFRRNDLAEVDVEPVRTQQQVPFLQVRADVGPEDVPLHFVGQQDVDDVGRLGGFGRGQRLEAVLDGQVVIRAPFSLADDHLAAAVAEVLRLGVPLAAVAQDGDRLVLEQRQVGVVVVVNFRGHGSILRALGSVYSGDSDAKNQADSGFGVDSGSWRGRALAGAFDGEGVVPQHGDPPGADHFQDAERAASAR